MSSTKTQHRFSVLALLCIYVFAVARPALPLAKDFLAHLLWESEHLSTVHFENGKYHIHLDLAKESEEQNENTRDSENSSANELLANHTGLEKFEIVNSSPENISHLEFLLKKNPEVIISLTAPPPKA